MEQLQVLVSNFKIIVEQDHSPSTASFYWGNMKIYYEWIDLHDHLWSTESTIRRYMDAERLRGLSANSLIARHSSFLRFFKWLRESGQMEGPSPMDNIKRPRKPKLAARRAARKDVLGVIGSIPFANWWLDQRDRTILQIFLCCGLRIGELCALTIEDVDMNEWKLSVPSFKFSKPRTIPLGHDEIEGSNTIRYDLENWLRLRPMNHDTRKLFVGYAGPYSARGPLGTDGARAAIKKRCRAAGIKYFNPHSIRHCFATEAINTPEMRAEVLQVLLGHSSIVTTLEIYAEVLNDRILEEARDVLARVNSY